MIKIPPDRLAPEVLQSLIESYITREGTDYGTIELSLEEKVQSLMPSIRSGEVVITFDQETESVSLMNQSDYLKILAASGAENA